MAVKISTFHVLSDRPKVQVYVLWVCLKAHQI